MAYPIPAIALEHYFHQFLSNWHAEIRPSFSVETDDDGSVVLNMEVVCTQEDQLIYHEKFTCPTNCCKRSGRV